MSPSGPPMETEGLDLKGFGVDLVKAAEIGDREEVGRLLSLEAPVNIRCPPAGEFNNGMCKVVSGEKNLKPGMIWFEGLDLVSKKRELREIRACELARSALQAGSDGGYEEIVRQLISAGAEVNAGPAEYYGRTAIQAAAEGGHEELVKFLIREGAEVNALPAKHGRTALQAAAEGGHEELVKFLVSEGAEVNALPAREDGRTALQAAAGGGHEEVVKFLISAGAEVNAGPAEYSLMTALEAAAWEGHEEVVKFLISGEFETNTTPADLKGRRDALRAAESNKHERIIKILANADHERTVVDLARYNGSDKIKMIEYLIEAPKLSCKLWGRCGLTLLHESMRKLYKVGIRIWKSKPEI